MGNFICETTRHGHKMKKLILDNEFSHQLQKAFNKHHIDFQFVQQHIHRVAHEYLNGIQFAHQFYRRS